MLILFYMKEFIIKALVLDKEDMGDFDSRIFLYSPEYGKIIAKVKSSKKILSKLNSHLEPFNFIDARVINKIGMPQIVDALLIEKLKPSWSLCKLLKFVKEITLDGQSDYYFWHLIKQSLFSGRINYHQLLASQGFDPKFAVCQNCQQSSPRYFLYKEQTFCCKECLYTLNYEIDTVAFEMNFGQIEA